MAGSRHWPWVLVFCVHFAVNFNFCGVAFVVCISKSKCYFN